MCGVCVNDAKCVTTIDNCVLKRVLFHQHSNLTCSQIIHPKISSESKNKRKIKQKCRTYTEKRVRGCGCEGFIMVGFPSSDVDVYMLLHIVAAYISQKPS